MPTGYQIKDQSRLSGICNSIRDIACYGIIHGFYFGKMNREKWNW